MFRSLDRNMMAVPIEWDDTRHADFQTAVDTIGDAGLEVLYAMQSLFAVIYENGVRLGPIPPADADDLDFA